MRIRSGTSTAEESLSDDAAHWMALLAMDQYGYYLSDGTGIPLADTIEGNGTRIALAYEILRKDDALPHSWDVTSDTVAAWMAFKSGVPAREGHRRRRHIPGRAATGIVSASALKEMGETCVDKALPGFLHRARHGRVCGQRAVYPAGAGCCQGRKDDGDDD